MKNNVGKSGPLGLSKYLFSEMKNFLLKITPSNFVHQNYYTYFQILYLCFENLLTRCNNCT